MKKVLLIVAFALAFMPNAFAQKIKKEKKSKIGVSLTAGMLTYSVDNYSVSPGILVGGNFVATSPLKKSAENRWIGEASIGFNYCSNSAEKTKGYSSSENNNFMEVPIGIRLRYILNPMGTRGSWYVYPGITSSFISVCPIEKRSTVKKSSSTYLGTEFGLSLGVECGIGYATRHLGFSVGPFAKIGSPYSSKNNATSGSPFMYGGCANFYYMF